MSEGHGFFGGEFDVGLGGRVLLDLVDETEDANDLRGGVLGQDGVGHVVGQRGGDGGLVVVVGGATKVSREREKSTIYEHWLV